MVVKLEGKVQEWWFEGLPFQVNHGNDCKKNSDQHGEGKVTYQVEQIE